MHKNPTPIYNKTPVTDINSSNLGETVDINLSNPKISEYKIKPAEKIAPA